MPASRTSLAKHRSAFSLVEVLIATVLTLLMMAALAQGFKRLSDAMRDGRSRLTLVDQLRGVTAIIRQDLENCTVRPIPPLEQSNGAGYFEYYDGAMTDFSQTVYNPIANTDDPTYEQYPTSRYGDTDDILMFTVRSTTTPFTGRIPKAILKESRGQTSTTAEMSEYVTISSEYAEVIYFMLPLPRTDAIASGNVFDPSTGLPIFEEAATTTVGFPREYRLFRRVLLIRPDLNLPSGALFGTTVNTSAPLLTQMAAIHQNMDLSVRRERGDSNRVIANTLEDLKRRENRFAHWVSSAGGSDTSMPLLALTSSLRVAGQTITPSPISLPFSGFLRPEFALSDGRLGEDMLMSGVIGFDIKGFDPRAKIIASSSGQFAFGPSDPGYLSENSPSLVGKGEFTDLAWGPKIRVSPAYNSSSSLNIDSTWVTPLSGLEGIPTNVASMPFTLALLKSGVLSTPSGSAIEFYQPTFDTWDSSYETDDQGITVSGTTRLWKNGQDYFGLNSNGIPQDLTAGAGANGLDDNQNGVIDDESERDTSPPFPNALPAIKIELRVQDFGTGVIQQMSVLQDFVSH